MDEKALRSVNEISPLVVEANPLLIRRLRKLLPEKVLVESHANACAVVT